MVIKEHNQIIKVENLHQAISRQPVLSNINFTVKEGECLGVFGTRGAGKTTLLHILAGVDKFSSGNVEVMGCKLFKEQSFKKDMGLLTQKPSQFSDLKTGENVEFISVLKNVSKKHMEEVIKEHELEEYLEDSINRLEPGVYQRVSLACAMLNRPKLLILDEVIKDIDIESRYIIIDKLNEFKRQGGTLICGFSNMELSSHMEMDQIGWLENQDISLMTPNQAQQKWKSLISGEGRKGDIVNA